MTRLPAGQLRATPFSVICHQLSSHAVNNRLRLTAYGLRLTAYGLRLTAHASLSTRSIRRSGTSHIAVTATYNANAIHRFTYAAGTAAR